MRLDESRFLKEVAEHRMQVIRDDGGYRHLRFQRPGTYCMGFDILTWPGHLAYTGDMGCYVFTRLPDMFEFFRGDKPNPQYWSEKVLAGDRNGRGDGITEFSRERFVKTVQEWLNDAEAPQEVRDAADRVVLPCSYDGEHEAMRAAIQFEHDGKLWLQDFWEANCREYTHRFEWCCYALPWAIKQYDEASVAIRGTGADRA